MSDQTKPTIKGLPVPGYQDQTQQRVDLVSANKHIEEQSLRVLDDLANSGLCNPRDLAIGRTQLETAWMWINRSVFQPQRVKLPGDPL